MATRITNLRFPASPIRLSQLQLALSRQKIPAWRLRPPLPVAPPTDDHPTFSFPRPPGALSIHDHPLDESLERLELDKWGWVIYRTSYKDEAAWERLRDCMTRWSRDALEDEDASPRVRGTVDWRFVSDPTLEGASHDELRGRFRAWRDAVYLTETRRPPPQEDDDRTQRYMYFVEVDEPALESVARGGGGLTVVNLVRVDHGVPYAAEAEDEDVWPVLARTAVSPEFWIDVLDSVEWGWDYDCGIGDVMKTEREMIERGRG